MIRHLDIEIEKYVTQKLFGRVPLLTEIQKLVEHLSPAQLGVRVALAMVGIEEQGPNNSGKLVESIQRTIGKAEREPWCMCTVQTVEAFKEKWLKIISSFPITEHCQTAYVEAKNKGLLVTDPRASDVIIWQDYKNNVPQSTGHTGIIVISGDAYVTTVEGNTDPTGGINRDGNGIFQNHRSKEGYGVKKVRGFIRPRYTLA